nr:hypothetical protein CFP56_23473 [Quercus suber]
MPTLHHYANWFLASSAGPIIDDYPVSEGSVLGGIAHIQRALEARLGSNVEALQAQERELWQRERENQAVAMERERSQHIAEADLLQGYIGFLIGEMRGQGMSVPLAPYIPGRDPPIQRHETEYMLVPLGPAGG